MIAFLEILNPFINNFNLISLSVCPSLSLFDSAARTYVRERFIDLGSISACRALTEKQPGASDLQLVQQHSARWHCLNAMVSDREGSRI